MRSSNPKSLGALAAVLACAAALLGIGAPAASAAPEAKLGWSLQSTFGSGQSTAFEVTHNPIVVDSHGNVFVVYQSAGPVNGYASDGTFLGQYNFNSGVVGNLALDPGDNTVYTAEMFGGPFITRHVSDGAATPTYTQDPGFSVPVGPGMAVDATTHDLLVTDPGAEAVRRYDTTGTLVDTISTPSINPAWIVAAPDGSFYVAPDGGSDITHLSGTGTVLGTITGVGALQGLAFDPVHNFLVAAVENSVNTYTAAGALLFSEAKGGATGLGAGGSGRLYELAGGPINAYAFATFPDAETPVVSEVQATSAHVSAEVDPGAGPPADSVAHFEYSVDGGITWTSTPDQSVERTGTEGPDIIEADLTGLQQNSAYLVRVKASNPLASDTSATASFGTLEVAPEVETGDVSDRSQTSATLYGTVNPVGLPTTYHFEYGTTTSYGSRVPLETEAPAGSLRIPREVSRLVTGLQPGTTYHYRLVAENAAGTTAGTDRTFTTLAASEVFPQRAYEQVTPVDKGGAALNSDWNVQTAADGSAIAVSSIAASKESESALILQNYLSRRGSSDWLDWEPLDPPQDGVAGINESVTAGLSDDFEHALVVSNRTLAPGGIAGGANFYVKDLMTGGYTFVGGAPGADAWAETVVIQSSKRIFLAAAPDMSWVVFQSKPSLLPGVASRNVYRWSEEDGLSVESIFPGGFSPFAATSWGGRTSFETVSSDGRAVAYGFDPGGTNYGPIFHREDAGEPTPVSASHRSENFGELDSGYLEGMTPDGRYVFFTSQARLTEAAPEKVPGSDFLYRYDADSDDLLYISQVRSGTPGTVFGFSDDGQTVYFDTVESGTRVWHEGETESETHLVTNDSIIQINRPYASKDGRYLAWAGIPFSSSPNQAYLYDAVADETVCVSCPASGKPAGGARFMAQAPNLGNHTPRAVSTDGMMFFDTPTRLLAADHNGTRDVYGYQDGRLTLISPGDEDYGAFFVDASADGSDVFFQTNQGLVEQDVDGNADVYDARVGGGFASQNPPPPPGSCQGAECAEAGSPPSGGPPTATGALLPDRPGKSTGKVTVKKVELRAKTARVTIHASQAGRVTISGAAIKATGRQLAKSGTYTIAAPLTASARAKKDEGEKLKVAFTVRLSGSWGSATAKYSKTLGN